MKMFFKKVKKGIRKIYEITQKPTMLILPGQIAFSLFLSIFPIITLIGFVASKFDVSLTNLIEWFGGVLPPSLSKFLLIHGTASTGNIIVFTVIGFYVASNGSWSILVATNAIYEVPQDNEIKRRVKSIIMTIILVFMFIAISVILAFGNQILNFIMSIEKIQMITKTIYNLFSFLKWPIMALFIFFTLKIIFAMLIPPHVSNKTTNLGTLFTTLAWMIITAIYSFYTINIADYSVFYGSISTIIMFMVWIYMLSYVLVIGISINSAVYMHNKGEQENLEKLV
mgnify:FL=1